MVLHSVARLAMIGGALVAATFMRDLLPPPQVLHRELLEEPAQGRTDQRPFDTRVNGIDYRVQPRHSYDLHGLVVSLHDSEAWWDYAHREWSDYLNVADLCVVWGNNISRDAYRRVGYDHNQWECFWSTRSNEAAQLFDGAAISNNHLITDDPQFARLMRKVRVGDQVHVRGYLADYTTYKDGTATGTRTTSVVRTDQGNGACEVLWVTEFEILGTANRGWRVAFKVALWLMLAGFVGWCFLPPAPPD